MTQAYFSVAYMIEALAVSAVLFGCYWLLYRRTAQHRFNRWLLLAVLCLPWLFPLVRLPLPVGAAADLPLVWDNLPVAPGQWWDDANITATEGHDGAWHGRLSVWWLAWIPTVWLAVRHILGWRLLQQLRRHSIQYTQQGCVIWVSEAIGTPFSWRRAVYMPSGIWQQPEARQAVLLHEAAHLQQAHAVDVYLSLLVRAVGWWNPVWWLTQRELRMVHEYEADAAATRHIDKYQYAALLVHGGWGTAPVATSHAFFQSPLKARIKMMMKQSTTKAYWKRWLLLPAAACLLWVFSVATKLPAQPTMLQPLRVLIDPGHGGDDPGVKLGEQQEKALTLQIAKAMQERAGAYQLEVVLTREDDELPIPGNRNESLRRRVALVTETKADVFISLHIGATVGKNSKSRRGVDAFVANNNPAILPESRRLASMVLQSLEAGPLPVNKTILQRKEQGIYVLDKCPSPAVLLELGYLTDAKDAEILRQPEHLQALAGQILAALQAYARQR